MSEQELKELEKKQKKLKNKEKLAIKNKANYIMNHSDALLKKIDTAGEYFLEYFVAFLMTDSDSDLGIDFEVTEYDYRKSLEVIFKLCYALPYLGFDEVESENIRNKLRLYTKEFKAQYDYEFKNNCKYVYISQEDYNEVLRRRKKLSKN